MTIDKVRAALEAALSDDQPYIDRCKEALSALDDMVLIEADLVHKTKVLIKLHVKRGACIDIDDNLFNEGEIYEELNGVSK